MLAATHFNGNRDLSLEDTVSESKEVLKTHTVMSIELRSQAAGLPLAKPGTI